jgi:hypothetical protein
MEFEALWSRIQATLHPGTLISNWTVDGDNVGVPFKIDGVCAEYVRIDSPLQTIPKKDFEDVWKVWIDYRNGVTPRSKVRDITRFSKYIISILHFVEGESIAKR